MRYFLILWPFLSCVLCFNFNTRDIDEIHGVGTSNYFGYSLLLQKGTLENGNGLSSRVIVGAPGHGAGNSGGSVYTCTRKGSCVKYNIMASSANSPNGNFLGSSIDGGENVGEPFITCAPRIVKAFNDHNFLNGWCFLKANSLSPNGTYEEIKPLQDKSLISQHSSGAYFYDYAFGQAGFDVQYIANGSKLILGAPGIKNWNGGLIILEPSSQPKIIPEISAPIFSENFSYLGYKVTIARIDPRDRNNMWYLVGSPRGSKLFGNVKIFNSNGLLLALLKGDEMGSYYGSALLAADLNNDYKDDILVGAPSGPGSTFDEGYVYYYRTIQSKLSNPVKLVGNKQAGAKFGMSIVSLGDIDLDSYNDIAIAAPYEDDGVGAVYIYRGSDAGVQQIYSQRLSPLDFPGNYRHVRGFGQGLSKGVDIDNDGHNDLAIGAYISNNVFIMTSFRVVDYKLRLETNVSSISSSGMEITFCVNYIQRSPVRDLKQLQFKIKLRLDYRVRGDTDLDYIFNVTMSQNRCKSLTVSVKKPLLDISDFKLSIKSEIIQKDIIGDGESQIEKAIPYAHGCGDDNICQTAIMLQAKSNLSHIILGLNKEITVEVYAHNIGEPGYGCELFMNFSNVLELRDTRDCILENSTFKCPLSGILEQKIKFHFKYDIKLTKPQLDQLRFNYVIKCLGENFPPSANERELELPVLLKNSPYIQGSSAPENFYFNNENLETDVKVVHKFIIGNTGPSPIKLDVFLALPMIKSDNVDIFEFDAKGSLNGIEVQCKPAKTNINLDETLNVSTLLTEPTNKTIVIDCFEENVDCLLLFCDGDYLYKSTEVAEYNIKITTKPKLLSSHYRSELLKKDILAFVSSAYIFNGTNNSYRIEGHASTMIFASESKPIPMWVYIIAGIVGIILLCVLVLILYKCHFFDRNYRDKLNDEKLMEQSMDDNIERSPDNNMDTVNLEDLPSE